MAGNKYLNIEGGNVTEKRATQSSAGVANANEIAALDSTGRLDPSLMPVGVGPDVIILPCSEAIGQGKYVNIFDDSGTTKCRLADNSNGRVAYGHARNAGVSPGDLVTIYFEGPNPYLSGLTVGLKQWLSTAGGVTTTAPTAPSAQFIQSVGRSVKTTEINTDIEEPIYLVS